MAAGRWSRPPPSPARDRARHLTGFVRTVLGDVEPRSLGVTYAARRGYYAVYGGGPGLTWLLDGFSTQMEERGLGADVRRRLFVDNPARTFRFASIDRGTAA